jgi:hypothetical protein
MKNLFVPYEMAVELKKLGFNEGCLAYYNGNLELDTLNMERSVAIQDYNAGEWLYSAPLYQQVIDWFRDKHNLHIQPNFTYGEEGVWYYHFIVSIQPRVSVEKVSEGSFNYYAALNFAIKESLKVIKK